jgi:hypothetical protein
MRLPNPQEFLRYASGVAIVIGSLVLLVLPLKYNTVKAAPAQALTGFHAVGAVAVGGKIQVVAYSGDPNASTPGTAKGVATAQ